MARDGCLCVGDSAKLLGVSRQTIHDRIKSGRYRAEKIPRGKRAYYEIPIEDLRQDIEASKAEAKEDEAPSTRGGGEMRRMADQQILEHLKTMWQSHGDLVRLMEKQLEVKEERIKRLEDRVDMVYADLKAEREKRDQERKDSAAGGTLHVSDGSDPAEESEEAQASPD
jgi:hypothetical protein